MEIKELEPNKQYAFIVNSEHVTAEDVRMIADKLRAHGLNDPIVLADVSVRGSEQYFGLYCQQCGVWWVNPDGARLLFYPAPEMANAHLNDNGWIKHGPAHLWQVQEFGKEEMVSSDSLCEDSTVCPVRGSSLYQEQHRAPTYLG